MMNRPPSPRSWYPPPPQGASGAAEWYKWAPDQQQLPHGINSTRDQQRARSPLRSYSPPRPLSPDHSGQRQVSPHQDSKCSLSPRNEQTSSPRNDQQSSRRPISPICPPSPSRLPSPRRERLPSPSRERQLSPRRDRYNPRDRPLSPPRERPRSPYGWRPRSPPRHYEWSRRRSPPPQWVRRSPPRYGPSRSPPRGPWDYGIRPRSPPRWGVPPPHAYERRWPGPPGPPPPDRHYFPRKMEARPRSPPKSAPESKLDSKTDDYFSTIIDSKDEEVELVDLGPYDPDVAVGQRYIVSVSGYFCKVCHKFYNSEASAKINHCKTRPHYDKFSKWLSEKKLLVTAKRSAPSDDKKPEEPPAKKFKEEPNEKTQEADLKYDPSEPTVDEKEKQEDKVEVKVENTSTSQNGENSFVSEESVGSDSETLITSGVNKDDGDYIEATLFNLRKLKVNQLKINLEKRGMKATGLKPLLLKRLEKVLAEEAATAAAESERNAEEKSEQNADEKKGVDCDEDEGDEVVLKLLESDVEASNNKAQWINERELERELLQLEGVKKVVSLNSERTRLFNGRRTNVEWTIKINYSGSIPNEGLKFSMLSHQQLPFVALNMDDDDKEEDIDDNEEDKADAV